MSEQIGANGNEITITIPSSGERDWATSIRDNCFATISSHTHQGTGAGAKLVGYLAFDQTEALITNNVTLKARNNAANGTIDIAKVDTNDEVVLSTIVVSAEFEDAGLTVVDDGDNTKKIALDASAITTATTRVLTMADEAVDLAALKNSNISATAAIALSKLAALTASEMVISDGSGVIVSAPVATYPSLTELSYVKGLTSAVQNQIDTKTDTGTANEITLTGTVIGLADNPVVPGTDSMVVPAGTTAQRVSTTDGSFRFNSDLSSFEGYKSGAWSSIGGGGGGLDVYHEEDFSVNGSADFTTGNSATPDAVGTGTLDGTLSDDASTQIAGTESLKYTMSTSSTNDFFINDADISLDTKQVSNFTGVDFYYKYDGDDDDIRFIVLDQDDAELTATNEYLKNATVATRFSTNIYIPAGSTGVRYGFQVVTGNDTKILLVDDIQLTTNPGVYKNLTTTESGIYQEAAGHGSTNNKIMYFSNATADTTGNIVTISNSSTDGWSLTAIKPCELNISFMATTTTTHRIGLSLNSTQLTSAIDAITSADRLAYTVSESSSAQNQVSASLKLAAGDVVRTHTSGLTSGAADRVTFTATASAEHVITPAKSNLSGWTAYTPTFTGLGTVSNNNFIYKQIGDTYHIMGQVDTGTCTAVEAQMTLPNGYSIGNLTGTEAYTVGRSINEAVGSGSTRDHTILATNGDAFVNFSRINKDTTKNSQLPEIASTCFFDNHRYVIDFMVPVSELAGAENVTFLAAIPTNVQNNATDWTEYTPTTQGLGTAANIEAFYRQAGSDLEVQIRMDAGTVTASEMQVSLPSGLSVANILTSVTKVGSGNRSGSTHGPYVLATGGDFSAVASVAVNQTIAATNTSTQVVVSSKNVSVRFKVPIAGWTSAGTFLSATPKNQIAFIEDRKANNVDGGTSSITPVARDLNTLSGDYGAVGVSLDGTDGFKFSTTGKYLIEWSAPAYDSNQHRTALRNETSAVYLKMGTSAYSVTSDDIPTISTGVFLGTITAGDILSIFHEVSLSKATFGWGIATGSDLTIDDGEDEVYTTVKITKIP